MQLNSCHPHYRSINIEDITYEDAKKLKLLLETDLTNRWDELISALGLMVVANNPDKQGV